MSPARLPSAEPASPAKEEANNYVRRLWAQRRVSDLLAQGPTKKPEVAELGVNQDSGTVHDAVHAFLARRFAAQLGRRPLTAETPLFSKSRCLFGLDLARQKIVETRTACVVEGYTDVVMAHQYGASNVVSALGTALTERQLRELSRLTKKVVLCFDGDAAGEAATLRGMELFKPPGIAELSC